VSEHPDGDLGIGRSQLILAGRLSSLGERLSVGWLTYNPLQMLIYHRYALREAPGVIGAFEELFPEARRYVDIGCGSGAYAAEAIRRGHPTVGLERSGAGRMLTRRQGVDCRDFDLRKAPPRLNGGPIDLAYCFEVAEHLPTELAQPLVDAICGLASTVVFSAAQPGQGGVGHINEQPPDHWHARFASSSFHHDQPTSRALRERFAAHGVRAPWMLTNPSVYRRSEEPLLSAERPG
jgi:SAM-dependent methyltransferase